MSPSKKTDAVRRSATQAAAQLKPAAERARPLAAKAAVAASKQLRRTRAWAAPLVERSGHAVQDTVAPKVSALLSRAARRLDPARTEQRNWRKPAGLAASLTAAGGAAAAVIRRRRPASQQTAPADTIPSPTPNGQQQAEASTEPR